MFRNYVTSNLANSLTYLDPASWPSLFFIGSPPGYGPFSFTLAYADLLSGILYPSLQSGEHLFNKRNLIRLKEKV